MINLFKFIIGTVIGSFITLSSIRLFRHESIIFPPSHCDHCHHQLKPWELIPLLSFIFLRGRCYKCHSPIGYFNFIGEILGGLSTLFTPLTTSGLIEIIFEFTLLFIAECDYKRYLIPSWSLILLLLIILTQLLYKHHFNLTEFIFIIIIYGIILTINHHYSFIGNGDVDLIFLLLIKTNLNMTLMIITLASFFAIIKYAIKHTQQLIPYTPYLMIAYFLIQNIKKIAIAK